MSTAPGAAERLVRAVDMALLAGAATGLVAMMLLVSVDILSSLILNAPIAITSALVTQYAMIAVAFLPILAAERRGAHIGVSLLTDRLPPRARRAQEAAVGLATAVVYLLLTAQSWAEATDKLASGAFLVEQTTRIVTWPAYFMVPVGFGAMGVLLLARTGLRLAGRDVPGAAPPEAPQLGEDADE